MVLKEKRHHLLCSRTKRKKTMKFLTQDGQLVEVDISKITSTKDKASNKEMQEWVKR